MICQVGNLNNLRTKFGGFCYMSMRWMAALSVGGGLVGNATCVFILAPTTRSASGLTLITAMRSLSHPPLLVLQKQDLPNWVASASDKRLIKFGAQGKYIATHRRSHSSSHAMPRRIFCDVKEREQGERKRSLFCETSDS